METIEHNVQVIKEMAKKATGKENPSIGFTTGIFDLIHEGHVKYLESIKKQCDFLVVMVGSDFAAQKKKGSHRPFVPERERLFMISNIKHVDYSLMYKDQNNRWEFIKKLKPSTVFLSETSVKDSEIRILDNTEQNYTVLPEQSPIHTTLRARDMRSRLKSLDL